jgi:transcriptional regulator with XRE-family HTH domain
VGNNKEHAVQLRLEGYSRSQIAEALGLRNSGYLKRLLGGTPAPEWTKRPNAKDSDRERAIELRRQGWSYRESREELDVSKSSLSLWLRDVSLAEEQQARLQLLQDAGRTKAAQTIRARRLARREATIEHARSQIRAVGESELFVAGLVAYWSEGSKAKPWRPGEKVTFCNSDPSLIRLFLRWLDLIGVSRERVTCTLMIHESAAVDAAHAFWVAETGLPASQFRKATLKRHNPKTTRGNTGSDYHGCLSIYVKNGTDLYRSIEVGGTG